MNIPIKSSKQCSSCKKNIYIHPQAIHLAISETGRYRRMKLGEVIVNSHFIIEAQYMLYVAIQAYTVYMDETGHIA